MFVPLFSLSLSTSGVPKPLQGLCHEVNQWSETARIVATKRAGARLEWSKIYNKFGLLSFGRSHFERTFRGTGRGLPGPFGGRGCARPPGPPLRKAGHFEPGPGTFLTTPGLFRLVGERLLPWRVRPSTWRERRVGAVWRGDEPGAARKGSTGFER